MKNYPVIIIIAILLFSGIFIFNKKEDIKPLTLEQARTIAESSICPRKAVFTGEYSYKPEIKTWFFGMDASRRECSPICAVDEKTKYAKFDLRCGEFSR